MKIKKGDTVKIIQGKDRGKKAKVIQVLPKMGKLVVEGLNLMVKNVRPKREREKGQVVKFNAPLDASNVILVCPKCSKPTRLGFKEIGTKKLRVCKKCQEVIE